MGGTSQTAKIARTSVSLAPRATEWHHLEMGTSEGIYCILQMHILLILKDINMYIISIFGIRLESNAAFMKSLNKFL